MPDIPLEETGPVRQVATAAGLELVLLTTPTTPTERMEAIAKVSQGFVYLVSVTGAPLLPHDQCIRAALNPGCRALMQLSGREATPWASCWDEGALLARYGCR